MLSIILKHPKAFAIAITFHAVIVGVFVANLQFDQKSIITKKPVDVVQATMVDELQVQREVDKLKAAEDAKRLQELARLKKLKQEVDAAKKKRIQEQKHLKDLERKRARELAKDKRLEKERKAQDKKHKADEKKRKDAEARRVKSEKAAKKKAEEKRLKDVKRKREFEAERKKEAELRKAEAKRKRAEERARKVKEAKRRADEQRERQRQIDEENRRLEGERAKKANKVISRYKGLIQKQVENNWRKPATTTRNMSCDVYVRMMPTGDVLKVKAEKCVGDDIFKRSVEDAVRAAAPLPLPPNKSLFTHFREITFKFKPND